MRDLILFGLTGGIASGKSTVGRRWRERGLPIIDADAVAKDVVAAGTDGLREVAETFGGGYLNEDGTLNRKALGSLVFQYPPQMRRLEAIVWPKIMAEMELMKARFRAEGHDIACYEAAIIVERGQADLFRPLVVVHAPADVRVARIVKRDGLSESQAVLRLDAQAPNGTLQDAADYIIASDRPKAQTMRVADAVLNHICRSHGIDPERYPET